MWRRWFLFLVCFGGGAPFFSKQTKNQFDALIVRLFKAFDDSFFIAPTTPRISTPRPRNQFPGFLPYNLNPPQIRRANRKQSSALTMLTRGTVARCNMLKIEESELPQPTSWRLCPFLTEFEQISFDPLPGSARDSLPYVGRRGYELVP